MPRRILALSLLFLAAACASSQQPVENPLAGSSWVLATMDGRAALPDQPAFLTFESAVSVSGNTGCNSFLGSVQVELFAMTFGRIAATRMACPGALGQQDARMLSLLDQVGAYRLEEGALILLAADGRRLMRFLPHEGGV